MLLYETIAICVNCLKIAEFQTKKYINGEIQKTLFYYKKLILVLQENIQVI